MEELEEELGKLIDKINELKDLAKCKDPNAYLWKKVEDGILDNLHKAKSYQRERIIKDYPFKYYSTFHKNKQSLESFIRSKMREERLRELLDK